MSSFLIGIHDYDDKWASIVKANGRSGWCVHTEAVGFDSSDYSGKDYSYTGLTNIVRLNNAYYPSGTIPLPIHYEAFAQRCANFVSKSKGVEWITIGNEIAHHHEWPTDQPISLANYLDCYRQCYTAIKAVAPHVKLAPAAVAPWNASTPDAPDWILQLRHMLLALGDKVDWINLHAYTRGYDAGSFTSGDKMNPPYNHRFSGWETLYEFMGAIPTNLRHLPVMATEVNGNQPWSQYQAGWVQALYYEIERWNAKSNAQQIRAVCLFRWAPHDSQWDMSQCSQVHDDLRAAVARGYQWREIQAAPPKLTTNWTGYVTAVNGLRLRTEPHTVANVVTTIAMGEQVIISDRRDDWLAATYGALSGWVSAQWVSEQKPEINGGSTDDQRVAIIAKLAAEYGVDERLARAVVKIESGGAGFRNGRLIIRFEPHVLLDQFTKLFQQHFRFGSPQWTNHTYRPPGSDWRQFHGNQDLEYNAQALALQIAEQAALNSASYGAAQIMGFNHKLCGYDNAESMIAAFEKSEEAQLVSVFEYSRNKKDQTGTSALDYLRRGDLFNFAKLYNGTGAPEEYVDKIKAEMQ